MPERRQPRHEETTDPDLSAVPSSVRGPLLRAIPGAITVLVAVVGSWVSTQQTVGRLEAAVTELRTLDLSRVGPRLDRVERDASANAVDIRTLRDRVSDHTATIGIHETTIRSLERSIRSQRP